MLLYVVKYGIEVIFEYEMLEIMCFCLRIEVLLVDLLFVEFEVTIVCRLIGLFEFDW